MVEAMKEMMEIIERLPHLALWVLVGLLFYKVVIIGSYFGVARLLILKGHDYLTKPRKDTIEHKIDKFFISSDGTYDLFIAQMSRIRGKRTRIDSEYIHNQDVQWLVEAINEKEQRERDKEPASRD